MATRKITWEALMPHRNALPETSELDRKQHLFAGLLRKYGRLLASFKGKMVEQQQRDAIELLWRQGCKLQALLGKVTLSVVLYRQNRLEEAYELLMEIRDGVVIYADPEDWPDSTHNFLNFEDECIRLARGIYGLVTSQSHERKSALQQLRAACTLYEFNGTVKLYKAGAMLTYMNEIESPREHSVTWKEAGNGSEETRYDATKNLLVVL
ncbi:hypothetical protein JX266_003922 [Neoarthrinium moseri]|nr:hypothetical protein JX266_003922 [Neoarthrinium moseri]